MKVKFFLNDKDMIKLLTASMSTPRDKDEHGKAITASE